MEEKNSLSYTHTHTHTQPSIHTHAQNRENDNLRKYINKAHHGLEANAIKIKTKK